VLRGHEPLHSERKKKMKLLIRLFTMYLDFLLKNSMEVVKMEVVGGSFDIDSVQDGVRLSVSAKLTQEGMLLQYVLGFKERYLVTTRLAGNSGYGHKSMVARKPHEKRKIRLESRLLQTEDEVVRFLQPGGTDEVSVEDAMKIHSILIWLDE
jgi:hypothetical protein